MHLSWKAGNLIGASAVVGTSFSNAVGVAYAKKLSGDTSLTVCFFGDGATEQGTFFESLNLAKLLNVRIAFVMEDNDLAVHIPKSRRQAYELKKLVRSFGFDYLNIDSSQPMEIIRGITPVFEKLRANSEGGQIFIRMKTFRAVEHVGTGDDTKHPYRGESSTSWEGEDPIENYQYSPAFIKQLGLEIDEALRVALAMEDSDPATILENI